MIVLRKMLLPGKVLLALFFLITEAEAFSGADIVLSSARIAQGECASILIRTQKGLQPRARWVGRPVFLVPDKGQENWYGFLGVDLSADPGKALLDVELLPSGEKQSVEITIEEKDWGVRVLTLPREMVELDQETLERVRRESRIMQEALATPPPAPRWSGPFTRPLEGEMVGPFGRRSIINEMPRSPHSGVDLRAATGTPVQSIHNGKVLLIGEHFFSGRSVVIDHGGAIQSMYFHLKEIKVRQDQEVTRGQVIGLVGATGRATGPHLHFGMRVNGARVEPMQVIVLSEQMGRP
jgi:murein DD-endopeptidase MepM/ murein hydrolase activator NlpD